jgi:hypothetical protein
VYPTVAGLPQAYLRKAVLSGLARAELADKTKNHREWPLSSTLSPPLPRWALPPPLPA